MKHAGDEALDRLIPLLRALDERASLTRRKRGVYYLKARAFLHFHEDASGLYADVRLDGRTFERLRVVTRKEQRALLRAIDERLS